MRPKDISSKLPKLISLIRIIWVNSPHYNTRERLTSLFRKVCVCRAAGGGGGGVRCWWSWSAAGKAESTDPRLSRAEGEDLLFLISKVGNCPE